MSSKTVLILAIAGIAIVAIAIAAIVISGRKQRLEAEQRQAELIASLGQSSGQGSTSGGGGWGGAVNSALQFGISLYNQNQATNQTKK